MRSATISIGLAAMAGIAWANACLVDVADFPVGDVSTMSTAGGMGGGGGVGPGVGGGGSGGSGGSGEGGGGGGTPCGPEAGGLGDRCDANTTCDSDLTCFPYDLDEAGPAGGMCSTSCSTSADCPSCGYCVEITVGIGVCLERCAHGDGDATKCHGRRDVAYLRYDDPDEGTVDVCAPSCNDNSECDPRACNQRSGLCQANGGPLSINPVGTACDPNGANWCMGYCADDGVCQQNCVYGAPVTCVPRGLSGGAMPKCLIDAEPGADVGDLAYCARDCRCNADCNGDRLCNRNDGVDNYCGPSAGGPGIPDCPPD